MGLIVLLAQRAAAQRTIGKGDDDKKVDRPTANAPANRPNEQRTESDTARNSPPDSVNYGFSSTSFVRLPDLCFFDSGRVIDTTLGFMHRYNWIQRHDYKYQNLGNIGTPLYPIFHEAPTQVGTRWGTNVYDAYVPQPDELRYFNSQAPFTNLYLIQGGQGKTDLVVEFARNINPEWNVELFYHRKSANRVIGDNFRRNDVALTHQVIGATTRFYTPRRRYKLLMHFLYYQLDNLELGGITAPTVSSDIDSLFVVSNADLVQRLEDAAHRQDGRRVFLYHEYAIAPRNFAIFHQFRLQRNVSRYRDEAYTANPDYYDTTYFDPSSQQSRYVSEFGLMENIGGIKARAGQLQVRGYAKYRTYDYRTAFLRDSTSQDSSLSRTPNPELFVGGQLRVRLDSQSVIHGEAEYLIGGGYRFDGRWENRRFSAQATRTNYAPSLWQQDRRFGNHYRWDNREAKNATVNTAELTYHYRHFKGTDSVWNFTLHPFGRYSSYENFTYYNQESLAVQDTGSFQWAQAGLRATAYYKNFHLRTEFLFSENLDREIIRLPRFFANLAIYYERELFGGIMPAQIGIDAHWKSKFRGNAFNPAIQQFHLQDAHEIGNYVYVDAFWNFRVNRVFLFLKINNLLQGVSAPNYFETPFYIAQPRSFEFGFQWRFFD